MSRLEQRVAKLEGSARKDDAPVSFELVFVSTDGRPSERFWLTDDGLVPVINHCDDRVVTDGLFSGPN